MKPRIALEKEVPQALEDNTLMLKVKAGELSLLGLLFERYHKDLYHFFYRLTNRDAERSEDLVQTVFMRILSYRHTYAGKGKFVSWMYHMARNAFADDYRRLKKQGHKEELQKAEGSAACSLVPDDREEELQLLDKAMEYLPLEKRELLVLSKFKEMPYRNIAEIMGCSEGNVKVKVFRAVQELKSVYQKLEQEASYDR